MAAGMTREGQRLSLNGDARRHVCAGGGGRGSVFFCPKEPDDGTLTFNGPKFFFSANLFRIASASAFFLLLLSSFWF